MFNKMSINGGGAEHHAMSQKGFDEVSEKSRDGRRSHQVINKKSFGTISVS